MALNIKNPEVVALVEDVARMTGESKTEAVRRALEERRERLELQGRGDDRVRRRRACLEEIRRRIPPELLGRTPLTKDEEEDILGLGELGVVILDTSAIVSVILEEVGYERLEATLMAHPGPIGVGAPTLVELGIVLANRLPGGADLATRSFLRGFDVAEIPFGPQHWRVAVDAHGRFGKGRHPARLNFGDCMSYATARVAGRPLLCIGDDFPQTDLELA